MARESGIRWKVHFASGLRKKGEYRVTSLLTNRRFPIVAGLRVVWDHRKPPNQRVESIHLVDPGNDDDDDDDEDEDDQSAAGGFDGTCRGEPYYFSLVCRTDASDRYRHTQ